MFFLLPPFPPFLPPGPDFRLLFRVWRNKRGTAKNFGRTQKKKTNQQPTPTKPLNKQKNNGVEGKKRKIEKTTPKRVGGWWPGAGGARSRGGEAPSPHPPPPRRALGATRGGFTEPRPRRVPGAAGGCGKGRAGGERTSAGSGRGSAAGPGRGGRTERGVLRGERGGGGGTKAGAGRRKLRFKV